ncbi:MAG: T9SS type A sorting domain-containing protein [Bacteroidota bacterium]
MRPTLLFILFLLAQILGAQNFTEAPQVPPFTGVAVGSIAFADVDGDNDQDVLITGFIGSIDPSSKLYINDGMGSFTEMLNTPFADVGFSSIAFADVDGDNDQDVLITGFTDASARISKLYANDGTGSFTEILDTPFTGVESGSVAFADVDGDNDQDVLITGRDSAFTPISKLYINDGTGSFTEMLDTPFENVGESAIAFADVDGDNDQDVLLTGFNGTVTSSKLYINDGMGSFTEMLNTPFADVSGSSIAFADVDGDNDQDVLLTGFVDFSVRSSTLYTNDGMGGFTEMLDTPFEDVGFSSVAFADVDGDNDQDVLLTGFAADDAPSSKLYLNDGTGSFTEMMNTPLEDVEGSSIAFADVDGDNDQDVLLTGGNSSFARISKLYLNNGMTSSADDSSVYPGLHLIPFPNPTTSDHLRISFDSQASHSATIRVYTMSGQLVKQQEEPVGIGVQTLVIDITSLPAGSYLIKLENGQQSGVTKFIIE